MPKVFFGISRHQVDLKSLCALLSAKRIAQKLLVTVDSYLLYRPVAEKENVISGKFVAGGNMLFIQFGMLFTISKRITYVNFSVSYGRYVTNRHYKKGKKTYNTESLEKYFLNVKCIKLW